MSSRIKILQVCAIGFTVEKFLLTLVDELSKTYDVTVVCSYDKISDSLKNEGYRIKNIDINRKINLIKNIKSVICLYRYIKHEKFDIVHAHTPVAGIVGRIAARMAGAPVIIYTAHGFYFHDNMSWFKKNLFILFEKIGGWFCDYIFTQSTEDYHTVINKKIIARTRVTAIGNGVDIEKFNINAVKKEISFRLKEEFDIKDEEIVIGIIGRVVKEKGYLEWMRAAKKVIEKYKNIKFLAIGDTLATDRDGIKKEVDKFIEENCMQDKVIFTGNRSDIPELLSIIDIFTLPSYREGMPRSLIEAMSMSKPAIATNIRGCREEIADGITGFLVPVCDYECLADKIIYLIDNPEIRVKMGENARRRVEMEFNEKMVINKQIEVIKSLISEKIDFKNEKRMSQV